MISVACFNQCLALSAHRYSLYYQCTDMVPLDQELQTQIPTGARWITQLKQSNAAVNRSHLKAAIGAQLHPIVP